MRLQYFQHASVSPSRVAGHLLRFLVSADLLFPQSAPRLKVLNLVSAHRLCIYYSHSLDDWKYPGKRLIISFLAKPELAVQEESDWGLTLSSAGSIA